MIFLAAAPPTSYSNGLAVTLASVIGLAVVIALGILASRSPDGPQAPVGWSWPERAVQRRRPPDLESTSRPGGLRTVRSAGFEPATS